CIIARSRSKDARRDSNLEAAEAIAGAPFRATLTIEDTWGREEVACRARSGSQLLPWMVPPPPRRMLLFPWRRRLKPAQRSSNPLHHRRSSPSSRSSSCSTPCTATL
ncbi:unnamed protein product, partial [Musa acuminata subsp. burmannicoides]